MNKEISIDFSIDEELLQLRSSSYSEKSEFLHPSGITDEVRLWGKKSFIGFNILRCEKMLFDNGMSTLYISLRLKAVSYKGLYFNTVQCSLNFENLQGRVIDMVPSGVIEDDSIEISTTYNGGLKFEIAKISLGPYAGVEKQKKANVYVPKIVSHGIDDKGCGWEFRKTEAHELYLEKILEVLIEIPNELNNSSFHIHCNFELRADGIKGLIPFWGARSIELEKLVEIKK